uniref:Uncharacterized protein n=1 Tax=Vespula pensylvanica TaxID=30213 RepID=A0A834PI23_VESPE|nr:hypothetical protein H0235_002006 [Vespula pensylvanica]
MKATRCNSQLVIATQLFRNIVDDDDDDDDEEDDDEDEDDHDGEAKDEGDWSLGYPFHSSTVAVAAGSVACGGDGGGGSSRVD